NADFLYILPEITRPMLHVPEHPIKLARFGVWSGVPAALLARWWSTPEARGLFAGVAAHAFRRFDSPLSSAVGVTLATAAHRFGWRGAGGGSAAIGAGRVEAGRAHGARFETGRRVTSLDELGSPDIVMLDVAPAAAVRIAGERMPWQVRRALRRYRHGPGAFK